VIHTLVKVKVADLVLSSMVVPIPADQAMRDVWRHMQVFILEKILILGSASVLCRRSYTYVVFCDSSSFNHVDGSIALRVLIACLSLHNMSYVAYSIGLGEIYLDILSVKIVKFDSKTGLFSSTF